MSIRRPTRLLDISELVKAYPNELLADFTTGNFTLKKPDGSTIEHKKPGTLTVTQGSVPILNQASLSDDLSFSIPEVQLMTGATASDAGTSGLVPAPGVGANSHFLRGDGTWAAITSVGTATAAEKLAAARTLTIGNSGKAFDGSADVTWTLTEIGAAAENHNHDTEYLKRSGGILNGTLTPGVNNYIDLGSPTNLFKTVYGNTFSGNATTASKLASAVNIGITGLTATAASFDGSQSVNINVTGVPASLLTGIIDIARLPAGALERVVPVTNQAARFALTTASAQVGDTVKELDTGLMYLVIDDTNLNNEAGYSVYTAGSATSVPWSGVTDKPTIYQPSTTTPLADSGSGSVGTSIRFARADHVHPLQTNVSGSAGSADKLTTARTITIGSTGKRFDGSANVSWSLTEIGAAAASHTHAEYANQNAYSTIAISGTRAAATSPTDTFTIAAGDNVSLSLFNKTLTISASVPAYSLATSSSPGLIRVGYGTNNRNYAVRLDGSGNAYVNVPWVDTNTDTTYGIANSDTHGLIRTGYISSGRNYAVLVDWKGDAYVNVPWTDNNTTYGVATSSTLGLVRIGYTQSGQNYPVALDSNNRMYVNVPWTDNNTTYGVGNASTYGLTRLYTSTGSNTDGTMTQSAINSALSNKLNISGGTLTGTLTTRALTVASGYTLTVNTAGNVSGIAVQYTASITTSSWTGSSAPFRKTITVSGMKSTDVPIVDYNPSGTYSTDSAVEEEFMSCIHRVVANNNSITVYVHEKPTRTIPIRLRVIR